jgi:hypothetical protein
MRKVSGRIIVFLLVVILVLAGACGEDETSVLETGIIVLGVTDKPDEDITGIQVTTNLIEGSFKTTESDDSEWQVMLDDETSFDLIEVAGIEDILGEASVPAGTYNQIRMHVKSVVVTLNGEKIEAKVPSGTIKLVRPVEIRAGEKTVATFDFDAEKSVVVSGADNIIFQPVVKLLVRKGDEPFTPAGVSEEVVEEDEETEETDEIEEESPVLELPPMTYGDEESFFLNINMPEQSEVIVATDSIVIAGKTSVDAAVSVGEEFVEVNLDGTFEQVVQLENGINIIEVIASIATGQQYNQVITVIYAP